MDLGDRAEDSTIDFTFSTRNVSAAPATLAGTPVISVYKANGTTQSVAGVTLTVDFDSLTGFNHVRIDTSADAFYATANDYSIVITTGSVNSVSVVGNTVATFSIENRFMRGTDLAFLAASAPTNFSSLVISGAGATDSLVQGYLNTTLTESTAGRINDNFEFFYDNANAQTTQVVDDVGGGGGGGTDWTASERNEIRGRLGVTGTTAAGGNTPTLSLQTSVDAIPTTAMRGTDNAATSAKQDTMETTLNAIPTTAMRGTDSAATSSKQDTMETTLNAIPTTAMRGTDSAATATALATAQLDLDTITGSDGATLATLQPNEDFGSITKNAAFSNFEFLMVLTSDHVTPGTGLTVTAQRSVDGGAFTGVAGGIAEISNGIYQFDALAADTNGDVITWRFLSATADDTFVTFKTTS